jgi:hypothetical protein
MSQNPYLGAVAENGVPKNQQLTEHKSTCIGVLRQHRICVARREERSCTHPGVTLRDMRTGGRKGRWRAGVLGSMSVVAALVCALGLSRPGQAAEFTCAGGDVACLIAAMNTANANREENTLTLEAGIYPLTAVDNDTDGPNGLPSITGTLTLMGAGVESTVIEREGSAPFFRLAHVAAAGTLTLEGLTLRGGSIGPGHPGGGLLNNGGAVVLTRTILTGNAAAGGGGIANRGGTVLLAQTLIARNEALSPTSGGGLLNTGTLILSDTTLANNRADTGGGLATNGTGLVTNTTVADNEAIVGGGVFHSGGTLTVVTTTFARNQAAMEGGGLFGHMVTLLNATLAHNSGGMGGGLAGSAVLLNTLLARNTSMGLRSVGLRSPDCGGRVISLGTNLLGDPTGCTITLRGTDRTGAPGSGEFTEDGPLGHGHVPLLPGSPAIEAGNPAFCPPTDQLGHQRVGVCDIGAVEFQPPAPPPPGSGDRPPASHVQGQPHQPQDAAARLRRHHDRPGRGALWGHRTNKPPQAPTVLPPASPAAIAPPEKDCLLQILKGDSC